MSYRTDCPECGSALVVVWYKVQMCTPLNPDGFTPCASKFYNTEDEQVACSAKSCSFECTLGDPVLIEEDRLMECPECDAEFPLGDGVSVTVDGKTILMCSGCSDWFKEHSVPGSGQ